MLEHGAKIILGVILSGVITALASNVIKTEKVETKLMIMEYESRDSIKVLREINTRLSIIEGILKGK